MDTVRADKMLEETSAQSAVGQADYAACDLKMAFYRKLDKFSQLQAVSGMSALLDANLTVTDENATDIGIVVGTSDGPLSTVCNYEEDLVAKGNASGSAFKFPNTVYNAAGGYLSICSGIRGYNVTVTSGTQSGLASIAYAVNVIRSGQEKAVLATGTDENSEIITELYEKLGCVTDGKSDGFRLSDGSTTMVLESESGMTARGAKAYAEVLGYGMATKPVPFGTLAGSGEALDEAISAALSDAVLPQMTSTAWSVLPTVRRSWMTWKRHRLPVCSATENSPFSISTDMWVRAEPRPRHFPPHTPRSCFRTDSATG